MCEPIIPIQKSKAFASQRLNLPEFDFFQIQKHQLFIIISVILMEEKKLRVMNQSLKT